MNEGQRRSGHERRSDFVDALIRLRLPDSYLRKVAENSVDWIRHGDREGSRQALIEMLTRVRDQAAQGQTP